MTILVTCATGKVGGEVVRQLVAAGRPVRALVRSAAGAEGVASGAEVVVGTLDDHAVLEHASAGVQAAFMGSFDDERMLELQANLIDACRRAGVARVARLSGLSARADSPVPTARRHGLGDRQLFDCGLGAIALQPTWFDQNFLGYFRGGVMRLPAGDGKVAFIDARDIAAVAVAALSAPGWEGRTLELTGPQALSHAEVAAIFSRVTGRGFRYEDEPPEAYVARLVAAGTPREAAGQWLGLFERIRAGDAAVVAPDVERVLGRPPIPLQRFAHDHAEALLALLRE